MHPVGRDGDRATGETLAPALRLLREPGADIGAGSTGGGKADGMSCAETTTKPVDGTTARLGFWSATLSGIFAVTYVVGEVAHQLGMLGTANSPESLVARMAPSLLLPIAFVILIAAIHACACERRRIWTTIALAFATIYAALVGIVYFVQLTVVAPRIAAGEVDQVALLAFEFGSFMFAIDILGYTFMSLATLCAAFVFGKAGLERWIRWALLANGLLAPVIALQIFYPPLFFVAAVWLVSFPAATVTLAVWFGRHG